jgi:hypothetical protein
MTIIIANFFTYFIQIVQVIENVIEITKLRSFLVF